MHKFTNVEMCRITEELIFQEPYQVGAVLWPQVLTCTNSFSASFKTHPPCRLLQSQCMTAAGVGLGVRRS